VIEDLHWIDKTSEDFLDYFIDWLPNSPILMVLLYRPEYTHHWGSKSYYNRIGLHQLTVKSSIELIQTILGEGEISPELKEIILSRAEGNPLYIEEFTQALLENGNIQKKNKKIFLTKDFSNIDIPDTIHGIIAGRIDRLDDDLKQTLQLASVIGRDFAFRVLNSVAEMNGDIASNLRNLQALEFIYERNLFPELEYMFKHALIQEVAYNSLLIQRRKSMHENVGRAIEDIYQDRLEEFYERLAYHYAKSDDHNKAYQYLKLSGIKASRNYGNWEALRFYRKAINILDRMLSTDLIKKEGIQIRLDLAKPAMFLSYPEDSIEELKIGVKLAGEAGDAGNLARLNGTLSHAYAIKGESALSIEHAESCFQEAQKIQDLDLMAPVARDLTSAYMFAGDFQKAVPLFSTVIPLIEQSQKCSETFGRPASVYTFLCGLAGFMMGYLGMFTDAGHLCKKALVNANHNNNLYELAYANFSAGITATAKGNGKPIVEHLEKCVDFLEQSQMTTLLDITLANLGLGYVHQGNLIKAQEYAERANVATRQAGTASGNAIPTQTCLALIYIDLEELEKAHACANEAVRLSSGRMVGGWEGLSYYALGAVLASINASQYEEAVECMKKALMILERYSFIPMLAGGTLVLAQIYGRSKQYDKALKALKKAEAMFKEMGMEYWLAKTDIAYADLYKERGDQTKTKEYHIEAIKIFKECGADGWVEKYEKELAALS
jgi:tetratricopeptide (TPR) repeat protein